MVRGKKAIAVSAAILAASMSLASASGGQLATAASPTPVFGHTIDLGDAGGEPSLQDDGHGNIFITTPQGTGSMNTGVLLSRSTNGGQTFLANQAIGGQVGGGDSDVIKDVALANTYVADLAAAFTNVLHSADNGATFPNITQAAPEDDREWLTTIGPNIYVTYHDFSLGTPLQFVSTDQGATFTPTGTGGLIIPPTSTPTGFLNTKCGTLVSKPVADASGTMYVLTNTSTIQEEVLNGMCEGIPPYDLMYMSVSKDGGATWTTNLVNDISAATTGNATSGSWGHVFNQLAIDAGGNLYVDMSGSLDGSNPYQNYLMVSKDGGVTFSKPIRTNPSPNGQTFPSIAVGQSGQVAVGYYQGTKPDIRASGNNYQFVIDQTMDALAANPTFTHTTLAPLKGTTPHPDGICTDGILCGTPASAGGNRNLADFESMAVDSTGHLEVIIPADCKGPTPATTCDNALSPENWFYKQTDGPLMPPGPTNGNGTGNQTWVAGARTVPPPSPSPTPMPNTQVPNTSAAAAGPAGSLGLLFALLGALAAAVFAATFGLKRRSRTS